MKSKKLNVKYFPFSPGIPWKIRCGKYIVPELSASLWNNIYKEKNITVAAFGGLMESFFSLSILEVINQILPGSKLFWSGNKSFSNLVQLQGLATQDTQLSQNILNQYPVPLFLDNNKNIYFNCLNNYLQVKTYYGTKGYYDNRSAPRQIFENGMVPWQKEFIPKFRKLSISNDLNTWLKTNKIHPNQPYVIIIPDNTGLSQHSISALNWNVSQVKAFGAMLAYKGIIPIIFTALPHKYYDPALKVLPIKLDFLLALLPKAKAVLSKNIDFLFIATALSPAKIFCNPTKGAFDLTKYHKFLRENKLIYISKEIPPADVFSLITTNV